MNTQTVKRITKIIWQNTTKDSSLQIYGVLDSARNEGIYPQLRNNAPAALSLFQGSRAQELALVAPYLVHLSPDELFTKWFLKNGWGDKWGILCETSEDTTLLRRHFQKILTVYNDKGKPLYFRFYDPRVLGVYLESASPEDLKKIFGSIQSFYVEGNTPDSLTQYLFSADQLIKRNLDLPTTG